MRRFSGPSGGWERLWLGAAVAASRPLPPLPGIRGAVGRALVCEALGRWVTLRGVERLSAACAGGGRGVPSLG